MGGTFVSVGNAIQPFDRLIGAVADVASGLPQKVVVQHGNTPFPGREGCIARAFINMDEFVRQVQQADLLILHAGAGSVIHAMQAGKVPVVMPRRAKYGEHVDDHQLEFAHALAGANKIVCAEEAADLPGAITKAMELQRSVSKSFAFPQLVNLVRNSLREAERMSKK